MDEERRDKVSQQIELVKKKNGLHRDLPLEQTDDLEIFAVLEAAKRVSFTREVAVTGMTSAVESCLGYVSLLPGLNVIEVGRWNCDDADI